MKTLIYACLVLFTFSVVYCDEPLRLPKPDGPPAPAMPAGDSAGDQPGESDPPFPDGPTRDPELPPLPFEGADTSNIRTGRLVVVSGLTAAYIGGIYFKLKSTWWKDGITPFHFKVDSRYAHNIDKAGHFVGGVLHSDVIATGMRWAGMKHGTAELFGAGLSTLFYVGIEVKDGYSPWWGFDGYDLAASVAGAFYPVLQSAVPTLQHISFKWSYIPTRESKYLQQTGARAWSVSENYEAQTYWLSVNVRHFLPASVKEHWPRFLNIAAGLSAMDLAEKSGGNLVILLAPDIDFEKLIPGDSDFMRVLKRVVNYIHPPLPAVRVSPNVVWYGLYLSSGY